MKKVFLNAASIRNETQAPDYLKYAFRLDDKDALDLDRLYSVIMSIKEETVIELDDPDLLIENLGRYGLGLIKLLRDAEHESEFITFDW